MRNIFKILPILLVLALLSGANAEYAAIVTAGRATVYADEGRAWPIGALPATTVITVVSEGENASLIALNGNRGYVDSGAIVEIAKLARRVQANTDTRVYASPDLSSAYLPIPRGMEMNLLAESGAWAMVENAGIIAYTNRDHLSAVEETIWGSAPVQVSAEEIEVLDAPNGKRLGVLVKGARATLLAIRGEWGYIELNGNRGFARISALIPAEDAPDAPEKPTEPEPTPAPEPTPVPEPANYIFQEKSVEKTIYRFMTEKMGLNTAAACGILANVERECDFRIHLTSYDGGYGIVQWTGSRNRNLKNWCKKNGYDYQSLEGQLRFLEYELEGGYSKILKKLRKIENSPAGAYEAAYYFCYNFEIPANRTQNSVRRGNIAKNTYWKKYAS